ncbi:YolD-like family protein [Paenibacillus sp. LHD-117]|uniref:YolD-like family protein n=1 Tax=Paenibacillus sp. LHD-117 TaxID=3071412 RepID=UPI0027E00DF5|nr:YolD-like family protein [Paenibacillus sp. LHD-117]MDQ6418661.1 YolD-like family protein [Paenibacillus sp. LHD-117]
MAKDKGPKRPTRDEYVLEEMGERLVEAHQEEAMVQLEVWHQKSVVGRIVKLDSRTKMIHVEQSNGETERVPFMDIMKIDNAS